MDAKSLGPVIRKWRLAAGLTQKELGQTANLPMKTVGSIERGERAPERMEVLKLCTALGKTPEELVTHWHRAYLDELSALLKRQDPRLPQLEAKGSPASPGSTSRIDQIIDQFAALAKELYRESRDDFQKTFWDWLTQSGFSDSSSPSSPRRARRRASRKRGSTKE